MDCNSALKPYFQKPIAIFGAGISGLAAKRLVEHKGGQACVFDERFGIAFTTEVAQEVGLVILSPGFCPEHPWVKLAEQAQLWMMPELDFASIFWPGPIITITGTNGKSTLTHLICAALKEAGQSAVCAGNIGYALSSAVVDYGDKLMTAVCEVSSFQSQTLQTFAPDAVLWTNLTEDHLERHFTMEAYFRAKWRLVERLKPSHTCVLGTDVARFAQRLKLQLPQSAHIVETEASPRAGPCGTPFYYPPQRDNYLLAQAYFEAAGLPQEALERAAGTVELLAHRFQCVGTVRGVTFWNDSKATNFASALAALSNFDPSKVLWIGGGKTKGGDIVGFARAVASLVREAAVIGEAAAIVHYTFQEIGLPSTMARSLPEAFEQLMARSKQGDVIVLSPGFASLDQFRDYADRGEQFESCVFALSKQSESV